MRSTKILLTVITTLTVFSLRVAAQDSTRVSIHQIDAEQHRWDDLKSHPAVPDLGLGIDAARKGDINRAVSHFQKAAPVRASMAYFNLGRVYFETQEFEKALRYFRLSYRARRDSLCREYFMNTKRLVKKRKHSR